MEDIWVLSLLFLTVRVLSFVFSDKVLEDAVCFSYVLRGIEGDRCLFIHSMCKIHRLDWASVQTEGLHGSP